MDISEEYIKMCEKAEEIQKQKTYEYFDYYVERYSKKVLRLSKSGFDSGDNTGPRDFAIEYNWIWLPRQDQLICMILYDNLKSLDLFIEKWWTSKNEYLWKHGNKLKSVEQHMLAFVMKEKYGKVWNGSEWVKDEI